VRTIRRSGAGLSTLHFLSGHTGSGKTTELLRVRDELARGTPNDAPAVVLWVDADELLDRNDVDLEDILIALCHVALVQNPAAVAKVLAPVWKSQIATTLKSVVANLPTEVQPAIEKLLGDVKLGAPAQRVKIREALGSTVGPLVRALNAALTSLAERPENDVTAPVVVLIDNLEKLVVSRREVVERLYMERMLALKDLEAHLVITVPIYLCYGAIGAGLGQLHGAETVILPMVKVRQRARPDGSPGGDEKAGIDAIAELLEKRIRVDLLFEGGRAAAEKIARLSGGCIRDALRIALGALNEHDAPKVSLASIDRSAATIQASFERALPEPWVPLLHHLARHNAFPQDCDQEVKAGLLRSLFVLEYQNGDPDPWWGVHPLVEKCRKFRDWTPPPAAAPPASTPKPPAA
jgi:hypothetical protein